MLKTWPLKIAAAIITGCMLLSFVGVYPAGAMIFPELLKLVRVDKPEAPEQSESAAGKASESQQPGKTETYVVKAGDTLWEISRKYNIDWKTLAETNNIGVNKVILAGQVLNIPVQGAVIHVVAPGESLWEIARKYNQDINTLAAKNGVTDPGKLQVGKRLVIPTKETVPATAEASRDVASRGKSATRWPVIGTITSRYGPRGVEFHHGLDIAAETGDKIYPFRPGKVEFAGWLNNFYGKAVTIDHGNGMKTRYGHASKILVKENDYVDTSTPIAEIGTTGRSTGPHLHFEVHIDGTTVDPLTVLSQRGR